MHRLSMQILKRKQRDNQEYLNAIVEVIEENQRASKSINLLLSKEGNIDPEAAKILIGMAEIQSTDIVEMRKLN